MTEHPTYPQEWQRLAWAIGADDLATDEPRYPDTDQDDEAEAFRSWAEHVHGAAARAFIATHDALQTIRFGPETSPAPFTDEPAVVDEWATADSSEHSPRIGRPRNGPVKPGRVRRTTDADWLPQPDTSDGFARLIQSVVHDFDHDWIERDEKIAKLAVAFAEQFIPGGIPYPTPNQPEPSPVEVAIAGETFRRDGAYYVALIQQGMPGMTVPGDDLEGFATAHDAQAAAATWNRQHNVSPEEIQLARQGVRL